MPNSPRPSSRPSMYLSSIRVRWLNGTAFFRTRIGADGDIDDVGSAEYGFGFRSGTLFFFFDFGLFSGWCFPPLRHAAIAFPISSERRELSQGLRSDSGEVDNRGSGIGQPWTAAPEE